MASVVGTLDLGIAMWIYSFLLVTTLTSPTSLPFTAPIQGDEAFNTDTECMLALRRMTLFYSVKGMFVIDGACRPYVK